MAISAATFWEVRATAGSDTNGGGFVAGASGTDYSQQNAAQYSATDLAVDATTNTKVTSSSHSFVAADVGNLINISAGASWTTGFYQIVSVSSGAATLDRSPAATSTTGGTYAVGGALATLGALASAYAAGNTVYVKASGTLTITSTIGTLNAAITVIGYTSTRGDNGQATITTSTNSVAIFTLGNVAAYAFLNLIMSSTAGTPGPAFAPANASYAMQLYLTNCVVNGCSTLNTMEANGINFAPLILDSCEIKNCTSHGVDYSYNNESVFILGCYIHDNGGNGINAFQGGSSFLVVERTVVKGNTAGIGNSGSASGIVMQLVNCAFINNSSDGIQVRDYSAFIAWNCIVDSNGGYGINAPATAPGFSDVRSPAFWNNTSGQYTNIAAPTGSVTLTGDAFVNRSAGNFSLNSTAGAGAACEGAGYPSTIPG